MSFKQDENFHLFISNSIYFIVYEIHEIETCLFILVLLTITAFVCKNKNERAFYSYTCNFTI